MKKLFKITLLATTVSFFVASCKGNKALNAGDSTKIDSSSISATAKSDTTKPDSSKVKADSVKAIKKKK